MENKSQDRQFTRFMWSAFFILLALFLLITTTWSIQLAGPAGELEIGNNPVSIYLGARTTSGPQVFWTVGYEVPRLGHESKIYGLIFYWPSGSRPEFFIGDITPKG